MLNRSLFLFFLILLLLSSCRSKFELIGTWNIEKEEMFVNGNLVNTVENSDVIIEFNEDGTGIDKQGSFYWHLTPDALIIFDDGERFEYAIVSKSKTKLVIEDRGFTDAKKVNDVIKLTLTR